MASTNKTPNYNLPQFISSDKPSWLGDINGAMLAIDQGMQANKVAVESAESAASAAQGAAEAAKTAADAASTSAGNAISAAESAQTTATGAVTTATNAATKADQASTAAAAASTAATTAQDTANAAKTTAQQAQQTAGAAATAASQAQTVANAASTTANAAKTTAESAIDLANSVQDDLDALIPTQVTANIYSSGTTTEPTYFISYSAIKLGKLLILTLVYDAKAWRLDDTDLVIELNGYTVKKAFKTEGVAVSKTSSSSTAYAGTISFSFIPSVAGNAITIDRPTIGTSFTSTAYSQTTFYFELN